MFSRAMVTLTTQLVCRFNDAIKWRIGELHLMPIKNPDNGVQLQALTVVFRNGKTQEVSACHAAVLLAILQECIVISFECFAGW